jgi:hypothetical protein
MDSLKFSMLIFFLCKPSYFHIYINATSQIGLYQIFVMIRITPWFDLIYLRRIMYLIICGQFD